MAVPLASVVEPFLTDRATLTRRGLTDGSRAGYRQDVATWARQIAQDVGRLTGDEGEDPLALLTSDDLTELNVKNAYRSIRGREAASTVQRRVGTLRLFVRWLQMEGHLAVDPTLRIEAPERPVRLPAGWDDAELLRLAKVAWDVSPGDSRRWPARDRAAFALLSTTGVRASELCGLTDRSLRVEEDGEAVLIVIGKGNRQRNVPVPPEALRVVQEYVAERDDRFGQREHGAPLLRLSSGRPLQRGALNHLVDGWIRRSGVSKQEGEAAHGFRHTFAKGLIRSGVPAPAVQALLGHEDLKTTGIYVKATAADVRDAVLVSPSRRVLREVGAAEAATAAVPS
ncbi:tyrosine-type recombinase/integrase [Cellulomonas septica]|uniref:Tyrosine-type recombinase/integrase n=1 Tax=Cellulomonas septica TaxID=285080 RepID=A0ABX1JYL2_9CELL|nr:tyrosine-type recombinase/integrase [Cellulomonas septica]NKY38835.1 tyrosine-type recombinase/integrase [Cellulomonas septica]